MSSIEWIHDSKGQRLALVVRSDAVTIDVHFFTPDDFSQQLGLLIHPKGKVIRPHVHKPIRRVINQTQETLHVRHGVIEIDVYDFDARKVATVQLREGDTILLAAGGHGMRVLEEAQILEVKQGPYLGVDDKEPILDPGQ
jgi:hypothetical protein